MPYIVRISNPVSMYDRKKDREKQWKELERRKNDQRRRSSATKERLPGVLKSSAPPSPSSSNGTKKGILQTSAYKQNKEVGCTKRILDKFICWQTNDCGTNDNSDQSLVLCKTTHSEEIDQKSNATELPMVEGLEQSFKESLSSTEFEPRPSTSEQADLVDLSLQQVANAYPNS